MTFFKPVDSYSGLIYSEVAPMTRTDKTRTDQTLIPWPALSTGEDYRPFLE